MRFRKLLEGTDDVSVNSFWWPYELPTKASKVQMHMQLRCLCKPDMIAVLELLASVAVIIVDNWTSWDIPNLRVPRCGLIVNQVNFTTDSRPEIMVVSCRCLYNPALRELVRSFYDFTSNCETKSLGRNRKQGMLNFLGQQGLCCLKLPTEPKTGSENKCQISMQSGLIRGFSKLWFSPYSEHFCP